jgi:hypothetical protein
MDSKLAELRKSVKINSARLSPFENYSGVNAAFWSLKAVHHDLRVLCDELRSKGEYELSDRIRSTMGVLAHGYEYRLGKIQDD